MSSWTKEQREKWNKRYHEKKSEEHSPRVQRRNVQHNAPVRRSYGRNEDNRLQISRPGDRRFNQRSRAPYFKLPKYEGLAQFKMAPCVAPVNRPRPFMGGCCEKCLPMSRASVADKRLFCLSVCNVLHIPHFQSLDYSLVLNILKKNKKPLYPDISLNILKSERILSAVNKVTEECTRENKLEEEAVSAVKVVQQNRAKVILDNLKTSVSSTCLQFSSFILHHILSRLFNGILVHKGQMEIIKTVSQDDVPLIYLPVHRSQIDYILISFILFMNSLKVPLVVIDTNLYIPILGYFTKFLGALYIRKKLCDKNKQDYVEYAVIKSYLTECLKAGHNLEFFVEGACSRSGKPQIPKTGLLSLVVNSVAQGNIDDALLSTVSISYEKIMEGNFVAEQLGQPETRKGFFSNFYSIWKLMHFNFGNVRLNFGQPFSVKEFLQTYQKKLPKFTDADTPPFSSSSDESSSNQMRYKKTQLRFITTNLAQHIIYDTTFSTSIMSTHLLAFLLITQYRKGATQQQLQNSIEWLRGELCNKKRDVGFTGESLPVLKRAVELLGKQLITTETIDMEWTSSDLENNNVKVTVYKPLVKLPHILELQYYANSVVPVFLLDSIVVNALYALVDVEICHFRHCDSRLYVLRDKLIDKAVELCDILQFEFIAIPPCSDIVISFSDVLDQLIEKDCLHVAGIGIVSGRTRYGKSNTFDFESDEEEEAPVVKEQQLKIDLKEESINHLEFLRNILSPFIESYWIAAITLFKLVDEIKEEKVFIQDMQVTAQDKLCKGLLGYEESFSADTFKNAIRLFQHWHIVEFYLQDNINILYLNDSYNCKEKINDIVAKIESYRK
ncbi:hypothetical protein JTE90_008735 [Oedothorax gibbosus]|uniref:Phospholipid/glycerol acyltransferase domain-containing protein n=1 Tax=Oedothorax gibbosus TaxID=931172 RepID=A0AAV6UPS9_9ARAC|nr:hypothetical protein JTE90_008735 [Oedothorax gibbosus]